MRSGIHANQTRDRAKILDYYRRSGANVFKTLTFDKELLDGLKAMGVTIIGRLHRDQQALGGSVASTFIRDLVAAAQRNRQVDFWEGYNEEFAELGQIGRYATFEQSRMEALEAVGAKAAIGCFSTGTPEITDGGATWARFRPALERARARGHALALHEYAGPYMQYMTRTPDGRNQWNRQTNSFTGTSPDPRVYWDARLDGWLTLRYRMVYQLLRAWGLGDLPLFITEGGIDDATPRPGPAGKGYKAFEDGQWDTLPGIGDYADQRYWYMWHASQDPFVAGVVDFGWDGTTTGWPDFDLSTDPGMVDRIIARETSLPARRGSAPAPTPTPAPVPPPAVREIPGTDVSHHQGAIDWSKMAAKGIQFAWIKASEGTGFTDPRYAENARGAAAARLLHGPYHFYKNGIDPAAQARHFARIVATGPAPTLPPALDFEDTSGRADPAAMRLFAETVELLLGRPVVYTARWWWTAARLGGPQGWAARLPLWCADYSGPIDLPATGEWSAATVHQHTSSGGGREHGASSAGLDQSRFFGTREQLERLRVLPQTPAPEHMVDVARLWAEATAHQVISFNPGSALLKDAQPRGLIPTSEEWDHTPVHVAQRVEGTGGAEVLVFDKRTAAISRHKK